MDLTSKKKAVKVTNHDMSIASQRKSRVTQQDDRRRNQGCTRARSKDQLCVGKDDESHQRSEKHSL